MMIKLMKVFQYDDTGWNCREAIVRKPSLGQMETAVRRLNKFQFPFVWFFRAEDVRGDAVPDLGILGGDGDFVISASESNRTNRHMRFASEGNRRIDVWLSDQGCDFEEKFVCHDVGTVLRILTQYAESGTFPPDTVWE